MGTCTRKLESCQHTMGACVTKWSYPLESVRKGYDTCIIKGKTNSIALTRPMR